MLNYDTILSSYDDKLTLMQWLKKVEAALKNASATAFHVNKRGDATLTFSIDFADGEQIESEPIVLQQGESVASARISNGQLILTLTNGDELNAGNILNGNLNVNGNVSVSNNIETEFLNVRDGATLQEAEIIGSASVGGSMDVSGGITGDTIEQASPNYSREFNFGTASGITITNVYNRCEVINNVLYLIANIKLKNTSGAVKKLGQGWGDPAYCTLSLSDELASKIFDIAGTSVHAAAAVDGTIITAVPVVVTKNIVESATLVSLTSFRFTMVNKTAVNTISCYFRPNEIVQLEADEELTLTGRVALTLI